MAKNIKTLLFSAMNCPFVVIVATVIVATGAVVITTAQLHSAKPKLRFCAGLIPYRGVSEIRDGDDL